MSIRAARRRLALALLLAGLPWRAGGTGGGQRPLGGRLGGFGRFRR